MELVISNDVEDDLIFIVVKELAWAFQLKFT